MLQTAAALLATLVVASTALAALAADPRPRPLLPGSIATLKAAQASAQASAQAARYHRGPFAQAQQAAGPDNQTMTAVLDARRAMLAAANESRSAAGPGRHEDAVGQGDGDGVVESEEQQPTATAEAEAASEDDQGDEHRPQNHR